MGKFEILCVTMHQKDFSKITEMNIRSDVVFANQDDRTCMEKIEFNGKSASMITTETRGVGVNRNIALMYATADVCLFADDDVVYVDDMEERVLAEFNAHPDADIMIFHFESNNDKRKQIKYKKTKKCGAFTRMPWAGFRIAFRRSAVLKANLWFTTLFGGGCIFPSGEDSAWLISAKKAGLNIYVSSETIGTVSFDNSTWYTGYDNRFYYGKGAFYQAMHPKTFWLWMWYFVWRTNKWKELSKKDKIRWMKNGRSGYLRMLSYETFLSKNTLV